MCDPAPVPYVFVPRAPTYGGCYGPPPCAPCAPCCEVDTYQPVRPVYMWNGCAWVLLGMAPIFPPGWQLPGVPYLGSEPCLEDTLYS